MFSWCDFFKASYVIYVKRFEEIGFKQELTILLRDVADDCKSATVRIPVTDHAMAGVVAPQTPVKDYVKTKNMVVYLAL